MWSFLTKARKVTRRRSKRSEERFTTDVLTSNLGEVVDLSGSGVRVRPSKKVNVGVGQLVSVVLKSDQCQVTLKSRVVRIGRGSSGGPEIGLAFVEIKPGLRAALHNLARFGFIPRLEEAKAEKESAAANAVMPKLKAVADYYGLLAIAPTSTHEQIRVAYHQAVRRCHPDASRSADQVLMFQAISEAYRVLRDPERRRQYDIKRGITPAAA
ncbi:MAG TPA: DnaJ domain-containing protein [Humisphaera sp.]|nr:DnaJ domain-containing protein [Humisphaera sp.]